MTTVVEKQLIASSSALRQPVHCGKHVGPVGHVVMLVIAQPNNLVACEAEGVQQNRHNCIRVIDAAGESALPRPKRHVVDANGHGLPHWLSERLFRATVDWVVCVYPLGLWQERVIQIEEVLR
eukprot:CAMPEP_0172793434 /NCGR_PEP_ID=MMETSP1074-20121228/209477_1 /TAXON_ID=2916 /ORGANISM="Ceratium fusus, Strain PA161109" /LENGTH=122 /DNA_ID=CAMNT_0013630509 /DNA_START=965 /DNA_END=1333 /DNA_ORIENTATION=+